MASVQVYCTACDQFMQKVQSGVEVRTASTLKMRGDRFQCPKCQRQVLSDFGNPY